MKTLELPFSLDSIFTDVPRETWGRLLAYATFVIEWNQRMNLTGAKSVEQFLSEQIADCIFALDALQNSPISSSWFAPSALSLQAATYDSEHYDEWHSLTWLDIGTGCGLPGLVWALLRAQDHYILLDSLQKRTLFLEHMRLNLGLSNVEIHHDRFGLDFLSHLRSSLKSDTVEVLKHSLKNKPYFQNPSIKGDYVDKLSLRQAQTTFVSPVFVSRGTTHPEQLLTWAQNTAMYWQFWIVFSSEASHESFRQLIKDPNFNLHISKKTKSDLKFKLRVQGIPYKNSCVTGGKNSVLTLISHVHKDFYE